MEELSIEEKAKRYDEAIERAKHYQKVNGSAVILAIFPELKESKHEKIRKWLINTIEVKEVDLDEEIKSFTMSKELYEADSAIKAVAEHFYELGLKAHCIENNL